jgi:hypothetical protein
MADANPILTHARVIRSRLRRDIRQHRRQWHYHVDRRRVWFDEQTRRAHRRLKQGLLPFLRQSSLLNLLTTPVIYSLAVPLALLDAWITLYQWSCFPIYGIARVPRRRYVVIDRQRLAYLNAIERANCMYCGYANGLIGYVREIAARTVQYWCPIRHARRIPEPHGHYQLFLDYGDARGYHDRLPDLRRRLRRAA